MLMTALYKHVIFRRVMGTAYVHLYEKREWNRGRMTRMFTSMAIKKKWKKVVISWFGETAVQIRNFKRLYFQTVLFTACHNNTRQDAAKRLMEPFLT